ncbi:MAG: hypothetical protein ACREEV_12520 [Dongiaceae bacterium]
MSSGETPHTVGGLQLHPNLEGLEDGILIRGMDGRLYWVSEEKLQTDVGAGGCKLPVDDQPLDVGGVTEENRQIREILQTRLDALPSAVNVQNAIRGRLRVPPPGSSAPSGPTQPRSGKVADDALNRLVVYIQRATGEP